ncbi:transglutaminase-like domain-containing protein [Compostibacter hankyongensis]|uniref:Protein SirB1 N-terminal domain-containing protein n=1 Tax=Compostibacter hankyongensis TaxID=1007089 RepID=A0ABP8FVY0_9BACT
MQQNKEISALFHLIDDPDQEVFDTVSDKILHYGKEIIPNLEDLWEHTLEETVQERIELLIHRVHYQDLQAGFRSWRQQPDLLQGALLMARYQFPDFSVSQVRNEIDKIKRNIWLELNNYLTPLEQVNVLNSMVYSYFGIKGTEISYQHRNHFFINQVIESRKGNPVTIGILYQVLCEMLDLPVYAVNIPRQFILGYFDLPAADMGGSAGTASSHARFYIDPLQGQIYTPKDVEVYLKRISMVPDSAYFHPLDNRQIISTLLEEAAKCFTAEKEAYKYEELLSLSALVAEE